MVEKTEKNGGEFVRVLAGSGWAPVSRRALDDEGLSLACKGLLGWLLTRPDDFKIKVWYVQKHLKIGQDKWQKLRNELEKAGYLRVKKFKGEGGKFIWKFLLTDVPPVAAALAPADKLPSPVARMPKKSPRATTKTNKNQRDLKNFNIIFNQKGK